MHSVLSQHQLVQSNQFFVLSCQLEAWILLFIHMSPQRFRVRSSRRTRSNVLKRWLPESGHHGRSLILLIIKHFKTQNEQECNTTKRDTTCSHSQPYFRRTTRQKIITHHAVPFPCGSSRDTRLITTCDVCSSAKTAFTTRHPRSSDLPFARTRSFFDLWISCKLRTGSSLGMASGLWNILTVVSHHSCKTLLGETQIIDWRSLTPTTASSEQYL